MKPDGITSCGRPYELHLQMCEAEQKWAYSLIKSRPLVKKKSRCVVPSMFIYVRVNVGRPTVKAASLSASSLSLY